ncbi:MAG: hypothetical protein ACE5KH_03370 [Candidatus Geothermarchaeales archaeon]
MAASTAVLYAFPTTILIGPFLIPFLVTEFYVALTLNSVYLSLSVVSDARRTLAVLGLASWPAISVGAWLALSTSDFFFRPDLGAIIILGLSVSALHTFAFFSGAVLGATIPRRSSVLRRRILLRLSSGVVNPVDILELARELKEPLDDVRDTVLQLLRQGYVEGPFDLETYQLHVERAVDPF